MLASSDPATFVALVLLSLLLLTLLRLQRTRWLRREGRRRLAVATGHPSTFGRSNGWADRRALAIAIAHQLAAAGLVTERRDAMPVVRARGLAGEYVLTVTGDQVLVEYEVGGQRLSLADCATADEAVREVARHAELRSPV